MNKFDRSIYTHLLFCLLLLSSCGLGRKRLVGHKYLLEGVGPLLGPIGKLMGAKFEVVSDTEMDISVNFLGMVSKQVENYSFNGSRFVWDKSVYEVNFDRDTVLFSQDDKPQFRLIPQ